MRPDEENTYNFMTLKNFNELRYQELVAEQTTKTQNMKRLKAE